MPATWIAFNHAEPDPGDTDTISEAAVAEAAGGVAAALTRLRVPHRLVPVVGAGALVREIEACRPGLVFNLCEGLGGDARHEARIAALWELYGVPFTGNSSLTLGLAQDKVLAKRLFESAGIPTPRWRAYPSGDEEAAPDAASSSRFAAGLDLRFPVLAKPSREDASLGIGPDAVCRSPAELAFVVDRLYRRYRQPVLVEEFIDGREFNIALLQVDGRLEVLPLAEINFDGLSAEHPRVTSYDAKWRPESEVYRKTPAVCPADLPPGMTKVLVEIGRAVFVLLGGRDYGRVDVRLDAAGEPFVLEYNPNPDISPDAGYPRSIAASGRTFDDLVRILMENNGARFR